MALRPPPSAGRVTSLPLVTDSTASVGKSLVVIAVPFVPAVPIGLVVGIEPNGAGADAVGSFWRSPLSGGGEGSTPAGFRALIKAALAVASASRSARRRAGLPNMPPIPSVLMIGSPCPKLKVDCAADVHHYPPRVSPMSKSVRSVRRPARGGGIG